MAKRLYCLSYFNDLAKRKGIYDIVHKVYNSPDGSGVVLILYDWRWSSDYIAIQRTSKKSFRVMDGGKYYTFLDFRSTYFFLVTLLLQKYNKLRIFDYSDEKFVETAKQRLYELVQEFEVYNKTALKKNSP